MTGPAHLQYIIKVAGHGIFNRVDIAGIYGVIYGAMFVNG